MKREIGFLAKFFLIYFILQALIQFSPLQPLEEFIAGIEANALALQSSGNVLATPNGAFVINASCTGLVSISVLAAIVFSLKRPALKTKLLLFISGAVALFLLNLARVYAVLLIAIGNSIEAAEFAHVASWFSTALLILIIWVLGVKKIARIKNFAELI